jgi:hypothetical protein
MTPGIGSSTVVLIPIVPGLVPLRPCNPYLLRGMADSPDRLGQIAGPRPADTRTRKEDSLSRLYSVVDVPLLEAHCQELKRINKEV